MYKVCCHALFLKNAELTNAGYGSSLNRAGFVECDAALMNGPDGRFGAIGAAPSIKNPVLTALKLIEDQSIESALTRPMYFLRTMTGIEVAYVACFVEMVLMNMLKIPHLKFFLYRRNHAIAH